jgi:hypothetical protein
MTATATSIARRHFNAKTLNALKRQGIYVIGVGLAPYTNSDLPNANAITVYQLDDNGTGRVRTFREVLALAGVE